jgi:hypothetical protein
MKAAYLQFAFDFDGPAYKNPVDLNHNQCEDPLIAIYKVASDESSAVVKQNPSKSPNHSISISIACHPRLENR